MTDRAAGSGDQAAFAMYLAPIFDSMFEGIQIIDFDWRYVYLNATAAAHGRRPREELIGAAIMDVYPGIDQTEMFGRLGVCMTERTPQMMTNEFVHGDGSRSWFNLRMHPVPMGVLILSIDITEERATEDRLREAQRLEAIGRLAGGIAHDFNNLLTVIAGYSDLILHEMEEGAPFQHEVSEIFDASERAAALTRQLLAFGRRQRMDPAVLDVNDIVAGLDTLLRRLIGADIDLVTRLNPALHPVVGDASQLEQIVMNLAVNARDAMPHGGRLTIQTDNVHLDHDYVHLHPEAEEGPHVMIAVSDTGDGMDDATRARIFEPFFTTKEYGKGTGLGLATVYGIVKQSGGNIWVYSEPGRGTTFKVYLPQATTSVDREKPQQSVPRRARSAGDSGFILVAEDDDAVRGFVTSVLETAGYRVLAAADPDEAIAALSEHGRSIDVLLTDVMLPGMGSRSLAERSLELNPELLLVYMSGYTEDAILHRGGLHPNVAFIDKPISAEVLLGRLRAVLTGERPGR